MAATLAAVSAAMRAAERDWWIIGSAAVVLLGGATDVHDIDVLLAEQDARELLPLLGLPLRGGAPDDLFRSASFARWSAAALPVEFMSGLALRTGAEWHPVTPTTRIPHASGNGTVVYTPQRAELIDILQRFGRPKDRLRARLLLAE